MSDGTNDVFIVASGSVSGDLAGILGVLTINGGTGPDNRLIVSDYGNTTVAKTNRASF